MSGALPRVATDREGGSRSAGDLPANGRWAEVQLDAPALRLRGRADLIERTAGNVVIRDLKTGRVLTDDGEVLPQVERQMRLYGSMARIVWPSAQVSLVVDHGDERAIEFGRDEEAAILVWLRGVLDRLPPDCIVEAESLATPGEACEGCAHRHVCLAYRRRAPALWHGDVAVRAPLDTWGQVMAIDAREGGLFDVKIRDDAGRTVKVFGLVASRVADVRPGTVVWLFGLRTRDKRGGPGSWRHPHNFFEVSDEDVFARAWTLESFESRGAVPSSG